MYSGLLSISEGGMVQKGGSNVHAKPYLRIMKAKDMVTLEFDMYHYKSILLYCRRGKETEFTFLGETDKAPFMDTRPNLTVYSEMREYMAVFSEDGKPIGEPDYLQIRTKGRFRFF